MGALGQLAVMVDYFRWEFLEDVTSGHAGGAHSPIHAGGSLAGKDS